MSETSVWTYLIKLAVFGTAFLFLFSVLQYFLCKIKRWWPGLILPLLTFLHSLPLISWLLPLQNISGPRIVAQWFSSFVSANIPTAVFLCIYLACRGKHKKKKQIEKMNIQDLK